MRNTIKNVIIVVPVFITSCHVSLNPNSGPRNAQRIMIEAAMKKVAGFPVTVAAVRANLVNKRHSIFALICHRKAGVPIKFLTTSATASICDFRYSSLSTKGTTARI